MVHAGRHDEPVPRLELSARLAGAGEPAVLGDVAFLSAHTRRLVPFPLFAGRLAAAAVSRNQPDHPWREHLPDVRGGAAAERIARSGRLDGAAGLLSPRIRESLLRYGIHFRCLLLLLLLRG